MTLAIRSNKKEILDQPDIPFEDIKKNMQELNTINTWLGGHKVSLAGLKSVLGSAKNILICEIGCGGGDNLEALNKWCSRRKITASFIGIDIKEECIEFAKNKQIKNFNVEWIVSDYEKVQFPVKPHIVFSSLFCHHFTHAELVKQLIWMKENSRMGFFINDLHRNIIAYYSIKVLTKMFSSSYLVKNDAPLSVLRGFKKSELKAVIKEAGVESATVSWKWAFRYLVTSKQHET